MQMRTLRTLPLFLLLASCGGGGGGSVDPDPVLELVKWTPSGDNQTDTVNQTLPNVIRVKVTLDGEVAAGITVNFAGGILGTPSMVTGSNGIATSTWTLAPEAGVQSVTASVDGAVGSPVTFHATAITGPAVTLLKVSGDGQAGDTSETFGEAFVVQVVDAFGNGVGGRWVQWQKTGPVTLATDSMITDVAGFSRMFAVAGNTEGAVTLTAAVDGLTGSPAQFTGQVTANAVTINVANNLFLPDSISVTAGSAVKWLWSGSGHSVSSTGGLSFPSSDVQDAGYVWGPILFATPGIYTFECGVHPTQMKGKIVVN